MHNFVVHSNESACRKNVNIGLDQVVDGALPDKGGVEYAFMPNDEDINKEIIIDDDERLAQDIDSLQNEILDIDGLDNVNEVREIEVVNA